MKKETTTTTTHELSGHFNLFTKQINQQHLPDDEMEIVAKLTS